MGRKRDTERRSFMREAKLIHLVVVDYGLMGEWWWGLMLSEAGCGRC